MFTNEIFCDKIKLQNTGGIIMAYKIGEECISCGACVDTCPVVAISAGDSQYNIDADACISCGACAGGCPVEAIAEE